MQFSDGTVVSKGFWPDPPLVQCAITGTVAVVAMPTADATLLPPAFSAETRREGDRASARHLEDVGVQAVLGAMIEQKRRASQPSFAAIDLPPSSEVNESESEAPASEAPEAGEPRRAPTRSEVFLKAR
jgi:hypothetical protein